MTPEQALQNLAQVARAAQLNAEQHGILAQAIEVLAKVIAPSEEVGESN